MCLDHCLREKYVGSSLVRLRPRDGGEGEHLAKRIRVLVRRHGVRHLVIEADPKLARSGRSILVDAILEVAKTESLSVERYAFDSASHRISDGSLTGTVKALCRQFDYASDRYGPHGPSRLVRSPAWAESRPIIVALTLAFAVGLAAFVG